jgi:tetratricopeptide (TPR) repeat protein
MNILSEKDITIAIIKATTSQIPIIGPFISEGVGAIDQKKTIDMLENRIEKLERILLDFGFITEQQNFSRVKVFHQTHDFNLIMSDFEKSLSSNESFESFIIKFTKNPYPEFKYFCCAIQLKIIHDILRKVENNKKIFVTYNAHQALISLASETLATIKVEDDYLVNYSVGSENDMKSHGYLGDTWHSLGWHILSQAHTHEQYIDSIRCFINSIELGADPMVPLLNIANAFKGMGYHEYALNRYNELIKKYPYSLQIRYCLAESLHEMGKIKESKQEYIIYAQQYDERLKEGASFPETSQIWRQAIKNILEEDKRS